MNGSMITEVLAWPPVTYLMYALIGLVAIVALRKLGLLELVLGKFGVKFSGSPKSSMVYVRAMLNVDRQKQYVDSRFQKEARRRTRNMVDIVASYIMAAETTELRMYIGEIDSRWRDLPFRSLLRGEVKDEIMNKTLEIYELNGLSNYSEVELAAKIERDFKIIVPSVSDIIRDGWANTDITWDILYEVLDRPEHKSLIKQAFADCIREFRGLALKKSMEYAKIDELMLAIERAAEKGEDVPSICFAEPH